MNSTSHCAQVLLLCPDGHNGKGHRYFLLGVPVARSFFLEHWHLSLCPEPLPHAHSLSILSKLGGISNLLCGLQWAATAWEDPRSHHAQGWTAHPQIQTYLSSHSAASLLTKCLGGSNTINTQISAGIYTHDHNRDTRQYHTPGRAFFFPLLLLSPVWFPLTISVCDRMSSTKLWSCVVTKSFSICLDLTSIFGGYYYLQLQQLSVLTVFVTRVSCKNFNVHLRLIISTSLAAQYLIISGKEEPTH